MKRLSYILSILILLFSCNNGNTYKIEGKLSNAENTTLYVIFESSDGNSIDTVNCNEKGNFTISRELNDNIQVVTFFYDNREQWFTVYPEMGKPVQVKGDASYPQLLQIKGGQTNNKLSEFRKKAAVLLKEQVDISNSLTSKGEGTLQYANNNLELKRIAQDFVRKNPKEEASVILISEYFTLPEELEQTEELLNLLSPDLNDFYVVKNLRTQISKAKTTMRGATAPDFKVTNIYGKTITPDSLSNKPFILSFTAIWCDLCRTDVMMLNDIATQYSKDSIEILLISLDDDITEIRNRMSQDSIKWNFVADSAGQAINLFEIYNVNSLPRSFLIDKDRIIRLKTDNGIELKQNVDEIMEPPPNPLP